MTGIREQGESFCAPHAVFNVSSPVKLLAGQTYDVPLLIASSNDFYWPNVSNGQAELGGQAQGFNWYYSPARRITVPSFFDLPDSPVVDGALMPLNLGGVLPGSPARPVQIGNALQIQVFDPLGDFDGDGLNNKLELETQGLDPTLRDTDGNGIEDGAEDFDGDGLSNLQEAQLGTQLRVADSDGDGLSDGSEVLTHGTDPLNPDTDGDGLSDGAEVGNIPASSPLKADTDGDGIPDKLELQMGLNPSDASDGQLDKDNDGLSNIREFQLGTAINNPDTDGDTLKDGVEVDQLGTDPLNPDTDGDGLRDDEDSEPLVKDTQAPVVQLLHPAPGQPLIKGLRLTVTPSVQDNGRVTRVAVRLNGTQVALLGSAPFTYAMNLPSEADSLRLELVATDTNNNHGSSGEHSFSLVDDPLTTVIGRVLDGNGQPIAGAQVDSHGLVAMTQSDGSFVITGVPVAPGRVAVIANGLLGNEAVTSMSAEFEPVWGGTTDVGTITLQSPKVRVGYFNAINGSGQPSQRTIIERAGYLPVAITSLADFDLSQVDMLLVDSSRNYYGNASYSNNRAKVFSFVENGGVLVFNEEYNTSTGPLVDLPGLPTSASVAAGAYRSIIPSQRYSDAAEGPAGSWWPHRGRTYYSYGYLPQDQLAADVVPLAFTGERADKRVSALRYPHGKGHVFFGYMPTYGWRPSDSDPLLTILQPNVLVMMRELTLKDSDNDGLKDIYEYAHGTSAFQADRDGDGLLDGFEVKYGFDPLVAGEQHLDSDGDGLSNLQEQELATHPLQADSDGDGLSDGDEVNLYNSDPLSEDTDLDRVPDDVEVAYNANPRKADSDDDGLSDHEEIHAYGTRPDLADSDGDGLSDFIETKGPYADILNPNYAADANQDYDNDGLTNKQELLDTLTNPKVADTDGDGLSDGAEVRAGLDPLDPDMDKDGLLDGEDSHPLEKDHELPQVSLISPAAGSSLVHGQQLRLRAKASDNGRVVAVTFHVNGTQVAARTEAPYEHAIVVPSQGSELLIEASARDTNGNERRTGVQRFSLIADVGSQVTGRVVDRAGNPVEGAAITLINEIGDGNVTPVSYVINQAPNSSYRDFTGGQLIDGQAGVAGYNVNLGQGTAYEWLGWNNTPTINIDFDFGRTVFIDTLKVGSTQTSTTDRVLPSLEVFTKVAGNWVSAGSLVVPVSSANNYSSSSQSPRRSLEIGGLNLNSRHVRVTLKANGNWTFVDEIGFGHSGPVSSNGGSVLTTTDAQGRFLANTSTLLLDPRVKATALFGAQPMSALSPVFEMPRGASIDVGDLVLTTSGRRAVDPVQARHLAYEEKGQSFNRVLQNNYRWDVNRNGGIDYGTSNTFSGAQNLLVNGSTYNASEYLVRLFGRELTFPVRQMGAVQVSRKVYVPAGQSHARFMSLIENPGDQAVTVPVTVSGYLYNSRPIVATSSGNLVFDKSDGYLLTDDDSETGGRLAAGILFGDAQASLKPIAATYNGSYYEVKYSVVLPPRSRKALVQYAVQHQNRAEARRVLDMLSAANFEEQYLTVEEHRDIANWPTQVDSDLDGLADADEVPMGLDPFDVDSDGDGLYDGFEHRYGFDPLVADGQAQVDTDGDGLDNLQEQEAGTHPRLADTDGDGLSDGDEVLLYLSNPLTRDTDLDRVLDADEVNRGTRPDLADSDGDGLDDYAEIYSHGTDPLKTDSDDDGMPDKFEVDHDLLNVSAQDDSDNDGLTNLEEFLAGTGPRNADTDGDELLDGWEVKGVPASDPLKADTDAGGRRDINERFVDGTDPRLASDDRPNIGGYRTVNDENNRSFTFAENGDGYSSTGNAINSNRAFRLYVNGNDYSYWYNHATSSANGREYHYEARRMDNLVVSRRVLVPSVGGAYVRYLEILDNPTAQEQVANVRLQSYYGASYDNQVSVVTSSGDAQLTSADDFIALRDTSVPTRPVLLHVFAGNDQRRQGTSLASQNGRLWQAEYQVSVPAGGRRVVMHFATLEGSSESALVMADKLRRLRDVGLDNLDADVAGKVVNFFAFYDRDEDGLSDADEIRLGTDIDNPDSDGDGIPDGHDAEPLVPDTTAPHVEIVPLELKRRYAGQSLDITANISDNGLISRVELFQDGELRETRSQGGQQTFTVLLPDSAQSALSLRVTDSNGNVTEAQVTVTIHDTPEIRLSGRVVDALNQPVVGAEVNVLGTTVDTDAQGRFSVSLLTIERAFDVTANTLFGAQEMYARKRIQVTSMDDRVDLGDIGDLTLMGVGRRATNPIPQSELTYEGNQWNYNKVLDNQYRWDFYTYYGNVEYGTDYAFSGAQYLIVQGSYFTNSESARYWLRLDGRELTYPARQMSGLRVQRKVYVPAGRNYARFMEIFENPSDQPVTTHVRINGNFYNTGNRSIVATSSGDQQFDGADRYLLTDDPGASDGRPASGVLFGGFDSPAQPSALSGSQYGYDVAYELTVPAGGRQILMHFAVQDYNRAEARRVLDELSDPNFAEEGLTNEELRDLVNWRTLVDSDNDGMPDADEIPLGLDPLNPDYDNDGIPDGRDSEPKAPDQTPPTIMIEPPAGPFYTGEPLDLNINVQDNGIVRNVELWQDGVLLATRDTAGAFSHNIVLPEEVGTTQFEVRATDSNANSSVETLSLDVEPVPPSSITGRVVNQLGRPVAGVSVSLRQPTDGEGPVLSRAMADAQLTDAEGRFVFDGLDRRQNPEWTLNIHHQVLDVELEEQVFVVLEQYGVNQIDDIELRVDDSYILPPAVESLGQLNPNCCYWNLPSGFNFPASQVYVDPYSFKVRVGDVELLAFTYGSLTPRDEDSGFYVNQLDDRLVLTWMKWMPNYGPANATGTTIQVILHRDGRIEQRFHGVENEYWYSNRHSFQTARDALSFDVDIARLQGYVIPYGMGIGQYFYNPSGIKGLILSYVPLDGGSYRVEIGRLPGRTDSDGDGLSDANELLLGTDPHNEDTDGDQLWDGFELYSGFDPLFAEPGIAAADSDEDGLSNLEEQQAGSDPHNADSDGDGLTDYDEVRTHKTDPMARDSDGDGLDDAYELTLGTDPLKTDTDGDGLPDGVEINNYGTNPLLVDSNGNQLSDAFEIRYGLDGATASGDEDEDGLSNLQEQQAGTHPYRRDTDGDALPDAFEVKVLGTSPVRFDTDGSGRGDGDELFVDSTDPLSAGDDVEQLPYDWWTYMRSESAISSEMSPHGDLSLFGMDGRSLLERMLQLQSFGEYGLSEHAGLSWAEGGRIWRTPVQEIEPGLLRSRELYMPADGRSYVRVLDKFYNMTDKALVARPEFVSKPAHAPYGHERSTSSGDGQLTTEDRWVQLKSVGYDANDSVNLMHVFADEAGRQTLSGDFYADPSHSWGVGYEFEVPANDHRVVMSFMAVEHSALPSGTLQVLDTLGEDVLRGIAAEDRSRIVNFTLCADADLDLLCDSSEEQQGTGKNQHDTDGDRFDDELEVRLGSDPKDSLSMPEFDIYYLKGDGARALVRLKGFDGQPLELREFEAPFKALDFDGHNRLWMSEAALENDGGAIHEFDPVSLEQSEGSFYLPEGELIDILGGREPMSLHLLEPSSPEEGSEPGTPMLFSAGERRLALRVSDRWGGSTVLQMPAHDGCGFGLAKWKGEPLILNDCQMIRFDYSISGDKQQSLIYLSFSDDFAERPRILSMDDMPWIDALLAIVEDEDNGTRRRHLGLVDMRSGEVIRLGTMPVDASGITVKFKDFQNEPVWPSPAEQY